MKKVEFKIDIAARRQKVWDTMFNPETYKEWVNVSWPGSCYEGAWKQGENLRFRSPRHGGTLATLVEHSPYEFILAKHIAVINKDGTEDRDSEISKGWIGTTEAYTFYENNGETRLKVERNTNPEWEKMFTDGWPKALAKLKEICEK
ncbi:MAG: SRPBCC domain-containing protein [Ginsengibacter sp.]